ncbi:MAG: hypothetical protein D6770_08105, partial [Anaerolineae bacterium]
LLADGPQPVPVILQRLNLLSAVQVDAGELFRREILARAGLTPTDLLHVEGRMGLWSQRAAANALEAFARMQWREPDEIRRHVWTRMTETIIAAILSFLSAHEMPPATVADMGRWLFENALYRLHPHLETRFHLKVPIIGIGAPAGIFLQDVARHLHTDLLLPENYPVANAVGAVAGNVMVSEELLVYPRLSDDGLEVLGYYVQTNEGRETFEEQEEALSEARRLSRERALAAALRAGADDPQVVLEEEADGLDTVRVRAKAMGNPRLANAGSRPAAA